MPAGVGSFYRPQRERTHEAGYQERGEERIAAAIIIVAAAVQSLLLRRQQLREAHSGPYAQRGRAERLIEHHAYASLRSGSVWQRRQWGISYPGYAVRRPPGVYV